MTLIQARLKQRIGTIAFDHYAKRNTLGADLIAEMHGSLDEFAREGVGVVVIRSASNERAWSAGHDVDELPLADLDPIPYNAFAITSAELGLPYNAPRGRAGGARLRDGANDRARSAAAVAVAKGGDAQTEQ